MPTVLKMLLAERHLTSHPDFLSVYDRCAAQLDPPVPPGHGPAKAQYYQWLSGRMVGLPRDYHRKVLQRMFPGWTVERLFQMADIIPSGARGHRPSTPVDSELEAFLGADMVEHGATLVYPARGGSAVMVPEGDLRGLLYVSALLQRNTGLRVDFRNDREVAVRGDRQYITFGAAGAARYSLMAEHPLFTLGVGRGETIDHVELSDGARFDAGGDRHIGLVARVRPSPRLYPGRYWFHCAGPGTRGAAGAGWFLANQWNALHEQVGDREFVAVVGVRAHSDQTSGLVTLLVAPPREP
ncbi:hypothetical protein [Nocardia bovistercoris]|uniref:Uncharacterized protein n=1 Tax=Nocardia bovistercoris TaxID=2785916 RepID=A0A931N034_9NOCA|nr:hypothetical protein [Nocardia bovistercoris]MBH0776810.1 hypothetical protein [Nocardia bovistercoris]